jgi:serine/threonine protein kinase/tetratricopeptide (TPR) repeat protein
MSLPSGKQLGPYKILSLLGKGGMGEVYRATDTRLGRDLAIKVLPEHLADDPDSLRRFEREAKSVAALSHPNILTIYDVGSEQGVSYAVMELLDGETLRSTLAGRPIAWRKATEIGTAVAEGLAAAHSKGVIHRDLKPENIFVTSDGRIKILDFGLARYKPQLSQQELTEAATESQLTEAGVVMGTVPYMSPEQVRGESVDARSDIFSFGCVLYEMITGRRSFPGKTAADTISAILKEEPAEMPESIPAELSRIIAHCLEKNPEKRLHSAHDLAFALREIAPTSARFGPARKLSRLKSAVAAAVIALAAIVALVVGFRKESSRQTAAPKIQSLAVLPLKNLSGDPKQEYFSDGMTEELIMTLARIGSLRVISRTSVMEYKETKKKIPEIAKELNVDAVVEGSVLQAGDRVRVTAQLINASTDQHIWAQSYERDLSDVLALQSEVASSIAQEIKIQLTPQEGAQLADTPRVNPEAYQAYLRGREHAHSSFTLEDSQLAVEMLQRAVRLDPSYAAAYAELVRAHSVMYHMGYDRTEERITMAKEALDRALRLKPDSAEAHIASGWFYYYAKKDYDLALKEFARAKEQVPNNPDPVTGIAAISRRKGNFEEAVKGWTHALTLSPRDAQPWAELGLTYMGMRSYSDAEKCLDRAISLAPDKTSTYANKALNLLLWKGDTREAREILHDLPNQGAWDRVWIEIYERNYAGALEELRAAPLDTFKGWPADNAQFTPKSALAGIIYLFSGRRELARSSFEEARTVLEKELKERPDDQRVHSCLGVVLAGLGLKTEAIHEGKHAVEMYPVSKDAYAAPFLVVNLAFIYALTGEEEAAIQQLEYLLSIPTHLVSVPLLRIDPRWDPLRKDPRFQHLLQKYGGDEK